jgi:hypothetical protein
MTLGIYLVQDGQGSPCWIKLSFEDVGVLLQQVLQLLQLSSAQLRVCPLDQSIKLIIS